MTGVEIAALYTAAFAGQRGWSAAEIDALLASPGVFAITTRQSLAIGRAVADEAEILTLAVAPDARRQGLARALLDRLEAEAALRGAKRIFLEVAENNHAAVALYAAGGYTECGRRRRYYRSPDGHWIDAMLMDKPLFAA